MRERERERALTMRNRCTAYVRAVTELPARSRDRPNPLKTACYVGPKEIDSVNTHVTRYAAMLAAY